MVQTFVRPVVVTPNGLALRVQQSVVGQAFTGAPGGLDLQGCLAKDVAFNSLVEVDEYRTSLTRFMDRFDQQAAELLIRSLTDDSLTLPPALQGLRAELAFPEAVRKRNVHLRIGVRRKIGAAVDSLADEIDPCTRARLTSALTQPDAVHCRILRIQMDDGSWRSFLAYRVQHNRWLGDELWYGGGLRWSKDFNDFLAEMLATEMTFKNATMGLNMGGGKGGIACDPKGLSASEQQRLAEAWAIAFALPVAEFRDKPAPDMGTTDAKIPLMTWMQKALDRVVGALTAPGSFTGKPLQAGVDTRINGIERRDIATGLGGKIALETLRRLAGGLKTIGDRHIVQGAGNAGMNYALLMAEAGEKVVGISDSEYAWFDPDGLSLEELRAIAAYKNKERNLSEIRQPNMTPDELLRQEADILVPAARHNTITKEVVEGFKGQVILELANNPMQEEAQMAAAAMELSGRLFVLPDILASGGGVTVSYFEAEQNRTGRPWTVREVEEGLATHMTAAVEAVFQRAQARRISMRDAVWQVAARRLAQAKPG